jgi:23S rRNA pseudouridine2604 synthase
MKKNTPQKNTPHNEDNGPTFVYPLRLNRYLSLCNYATRRGADKLIDDGKVFINGKKARLGDQVNEGDHIEVAGGEKKDYVYYAYYKPKGIVTIGAQENEKEISDVAHFPEDVFPIGRLDKDSEGLIIMTNDGRITESLLDPSYEHEKEYQVTVDQPVSHQAFIKLRNGVRIDVGRKKYTTKPAQVRRVSKTMFDIIITEGKKPSNS